MAYAKDYTEEELVDSAKKMKARARAQGRALARLKDDRPDDYRKYYQEEVVKAFKEMGIDSGIEH